MGSRSACIVISLHLVCSVNFQADLLASGWGPSVPAMLAIVIFILIVVSVARSASLFLSFSLSLSCPVLFLCCVFGFCFVCFVVLSCPFSPSCLRARVPRDFRFL